MTDAAKTTAVDDARVMRIWRECGLPEYFLGNDGTNHKLLKFADAIDEDDNTNVRQVAREIRLQDEARIAELEAQLAAMTEDRDLWQDAHDDDCPNKNMLETVEAQLRTAKENQWPLGDRPNPCAGYSCDGINIWGDEKSIKAAGDAFHYAAQLTEYRKQFEAQLRQEREAHFEARRTSGEITLKCGELQAQVSQLQAIVGQMREEQRLNLQSHAKHWPSCESNFQPHPPCTCGLDAALATCPAPAKDEKK